MVTRRRGTPKPKSAAELEEGQVYLRVNHGKHRRKESGVIVEYLPGQTFLGTHEEAKAWPKRFTVVSDPVQEEAVKKEHEQAESLWKAVHKGGGKYDIVNQETGDKVNDVLLTKDQVADFMEQLHGS